MSVSKTAGAILDPPLEKDVQKAVLEYLNLIWGVKAWRSNVGAMSGTYNGKKRFMRFGQAGQCDITGVGPQGVRIEIEIKRPGKAPNLNQLSWIEEMRKLGAIAFWCDSVKSCADQLQFEFAERGWRWHNSWNG